MKLLASAVALIMVGLTGMWLWFDATADAREDLPGVVVSVDDLPADLGVVQPGDAGAETEAPAVVDAADQTASVPAKGDQDEADRDAVTSRTAMVETLVTTLRAARDLSASSGGPATSPSPPPTPAPAPQPVNPAPATPPGMCWDDGELEECDDDWDDDWDDD